MRLSVESIAETFRLCNTRFCFEIWLSNVFHASMLSLVQNIFSTADSMILLHFILLSAPPILVDAWSCEFQIFIVWIKWNLSFPGSCFMAAQQKLAVVSPCTLCHSHSPLSTIGWSQDYSIGLILCKWLKIILLTLFNDQSVSDLLMHNAVNAKQIKNLKNSTVIGSPIICLFVKLTAQIMTK